MSNAVAFVKICIVDWIIVMFLAMALVEIRQQYFNILEWVIGQMKQIYWASSGRTTAGMSEKRSIGKNGPAGNLRPVCL